MGAPLSQRHARAPACAVPTAAKSASHRAGARSHARPAPPPQWIQRRGRATRLTASFCRTPDRGCPTTRRCPRWAARRSRVRTASWGPRASHTSAGTYAVSPPRCSVAAAETAGAPPKPTPRPRPRRVRTGPRAVDDGSYACGIVSRGRQGAADATHRCARPSFVVARWAANGGRRVRQNVTERAWQQRRAADRLAEGHPQQDHSTRVVSNHGERRNHTHDERGGGLSVGLPCRETKVPVPALGHSSTRC